MSVQVLADTHALLWYLYDDAQLSVEGRLALDGAIAAGVPILISAISIVEIVYLEEKRRIGVGAATRIRQACEADFPNLKVVAVDAHIVYGIAQVARADVPDMPDRIIAATAVSLNVPLVTRDARIRASGVRTIGA